MTDPLNIIMNAFCTRCKSVVYIFLKGII